MISIERVTAKESFSQTSTPVHKKVGCSTVWCEHFNKITWFVVIVVCLHTAAVKAKTQANTKFFVLFFFSFFVLPFDLLIGWQLSIWNCCKPLFSLLYNCQLLCFWRLALSIAVEVFPQPFSTYWSFKDVYYKLVMSHHMPYPSVASIL
jgi:hypothetical protein